LTGGGWIGTVGACTGGAIAMPAPDPQRNGFGSFNWAVVLRHEYTHAVTLSLTKNRIPHWFTEACAVWEQPDRRNFEAVGFLVGAVTDNKLFPIKQLDWGFIRPKQPTDRGLAYAQSEWIFEYILKVKKYDAILKMLADFRDGKTQAQVFQEVLGTTEEQFDKDFAVFAAKEVESWGFEIRKVPPLDQAKKDAEAKKDSADAQATLAMALQRAGQPFEPAARKALELDPNNKIALAMIGLTQLMQKKYDEAIATAKKLEQVKPDSAPAARILAEAYTAKQDWVDTILSLEQFKARRPLDPYAYERLATLYSKMGESERALPNLIEMHRRTMKDSKFAKQVADIYFISPTPAAATDYYEQVIQINPYDSGAYRQMAAVARSTNPALAVRALHSVCLLEPKSAQAWTELSMLCYRSYQSTKQSNYLIDGRDAAKKALEIDPNGQARDVLGMIEQAAKDAGVEFPTTAPSATETPTSAKSE
jgi:tetratricopeptide (TPR) repeat protein